MSIADRLEFLREDNGKINQKIFAKKIGANPKTVSAWESGRATPGSRHLEQIYRIFNVNINWLLTGEGKVYLKEDIGEEAIEEETFGELLSMTSTILKSQTVYTESLSANIKSSFKALELDKRTSTLEDKYDQLTKKLDGRGKKTDAHGAEG